MAIGPARGAVFGRGGVDGRRLAKRGAVTVRRHLGRKCGLAKRRVVAARRRPHRRRWRLRVGSGLGVGAERHRAPPCTFAEQPLVQSVGHRRRLHLECLRAPCRIGCGWRRPFQDFAAPRRRRAERVGRRRRLRAGEPQLPRRERALPAPVERHQRHAGGRRGRRPRPRGLAARRCRAGPVAAQRGGAREAENRRAARVWRPGLRPRCALGSACARAAEPQHRWRVEAAER
mmetsp:Transcript_100584/g.290527  ORF Transcript_100584/g.290527 Transcript_100584/m.290527 type:complete len:231 (+) Transcript_100584:424-1116(+)